MKPEITTLKNLLGTESGDKWLDFMDYVKKELPFLSKSGAPRQSDIKKSVIGEAGYRTWADFVEKELNWNIHSWRAWKKAFILVDQHPFLRNTGMSASEINVINNKNDEFPSSKEELEDLKNKKISEKKENKTNILTEQLAAARSENTESRAKLDSALEEINTLKTDINSQKAEYLQEKSKLVAEKTELTAKINELINSIDTTENISKTSNDKINLITKDLYFFKNISYVVLIYAALSTAAFLYSIIK